MQSALSGADTDLNLFTNSLLEPFQPCEVGIIIFSVFATEETGRLREVKLTHTAKRVAEPALADPNTHDHKQCMHTIHLTILSSFHPFESLSRRSSIKFP